MNVIVERGAEGNAAQSELKTPIVRLRDMLQGWANYVDDEEGQYPDALAVSEITALYRESGRLSEKDYPDLESEENAVCRFVNDKIVSLLLKRNDA